MVPAQDVQEAVDDKEPELTLLGVAELGGLAGDRRPADHDVSQIGAGRSVTGREGEDVGRVILAQEAPI